MVSPTGHSSMDIGPARLNKAAFVQLLSSQLAIAALAMGNAAAFECFQIVLDYRPQLEEYIAKCRQLTGSSGLHEKGWPK